jgi:hypothetical protein|tara:strand:- start:14 stop:421 length:408 start_codon:yes stop_codon:yes gene_type:complete
MNYSDFLEEFDTYNEWNQLRKKDLAEEWELDERPKFVEPKPMSFPGFKSNVRAIKPTKDDRVNSPSHYTSGKTEVIDVIEDAVKDAPSAIYGLLQGQVLKYMLRVWLKDNPTEDMKKARWYLDRLIEHYENPPGD